MPRGEYSLSAWTSPTGPASRLGASASGRTVMRGAKSRFTQGGEGRGFLVSALGFSSWRVLSVSISKARTVSWYVSVC